MAEDDKSGGTRLGDGPELAGYVARPPQAAAAALGRLAAALWTDAATLLARPAEAAGTRTVWVQPAAANQWQRTAAVSEMFHEPERIAVRGGVQLEDIVKTTGELATLAAPAAKALLNRADTGRRVLTDVQISTLWVTQVLAASHAGHVRDNGWSVRLTAMPVITEAGEDMTQQLAPADLLLLTDVLPETVALAPRGRSWSRTPAQPWSAIGQWIALGADGLVHGGGVLTDG